MNLGQQLRNTLGAAYTLDRELGGGRMSRVFMAERRLDGRDWRPGIRDSGSRSQNHHPYALNPDSSFLTPPCGANSPAPTAGSNRAWKNRRYSGSNVKRSPEIR